MPTVVLPGDIIPMPTPTPAAFGPEKHPQQQQAGGGAVRLTTGLSLLSSRKPQGRQPMIASIHAGLLSADTRRRAIVGGAGGAGGGNDDTPSSSTMTTKATITTLTHTPFQTRAYFPTPQDLVIATVQRSAGEAFACSLSPLGQPAYLPHLAFEGATKKTRPQLRATDLVYARVASVGPGNGGGGGSGSVGGEVELTAVDAATGRSGPDGLGPLVGGMVFDVSVGFASRLMMGPRGGVVVLDALGEALTPVGGFEVAVGRNGRVWVDCAVGNNKGVVGEEKGTVIRATVAIGRCLQETEAGGLGVVEQRKMVWRVLRQMGLGDLAKA